MDYDYSSSYSSAPPYTMVASSPLDPLVWVMVIMLILSFAVMAVVLASMWH